jgi:hypothetical protein
MKNAIKKAMTELEPAHVLWLSGAHLRLNAMDEYRALYTEETRSAVPGQFLAWQSQSRPRASAEITVPMTKNSPLFVMSDKRNSLVPPLDLIKMTITGKRPNTTLKAIQTIIRSCREEWRVVGIARILTDNYTEGYEYKAMTSRDNNRLASPSLPSTIIDVRPISEKSAA